MKPDSLLTIAGFDPSNGAGITADLQVFAAHGFFGMSAATALTVQSTQEVRSIQPVDAGLLESTLDCVVDDVVPAGIKIGMLPDQEAVETVSRFVEKFFINHGRIPIVLDPVMGSSSGTSFLDQQGIQAMRSSLLGHIASVTPNWNELGILAQLPVETPEQAEIAMESLGRRYVNLSIVATGGDCALPIDLFRTPDGSVHRVAGTRIETTSTHGTGCAFSSALLCRLASGDEPLAAVISAKTYVEGALLHAPGIGKGRGPMGLLWPLLIRSNN